MAAILATIQDDATYPTIFCSAPHWLSVKSKISPEYCNRTKILRGVLAGWDMGLPVPPGFPETKLLIAMRLDVT